jgi:hypothetical protein
MKDHFVKMAVTLIGKDNAVKIIRQIGVENGINPKQISKNIKEVLSCEYFTSAKKQNEVDVVKEISYE